MLRSLFYPSGVDMISEAEYSVVSKKSPKVADGIQGLS
jgi:hypothetical protein